MGNPSVTDLDLLRALARRGASTVCEDEETLAIVIERKGQRRVMARAGREQFEDLLVLGLVRRDDGGYAITRNGLSEFRRRLASPGTGAGAKRRQVMRARSRGRLPEMNGAESPLQWLRQRKDRRGEPMISASEFEAGERLRADFHIAGLHQRTTANWDLGVPADGPCGPPRQNLSDRALDARERVRMALQAVGPELADLLVDVCCYLRGLTEIERKADWPVRTGKVILRIGLKRLAVHYGLISGPAGRSPRRRLAGSEYCDV